MRTGLQPASPTDHTGGATIDDRTKLIMRLAHYTTPFWFTTLHQILDDHEYEDDKMMIADDVSQRQPSSHSAQYRT